MTECDREYDPQDLQMGTVSILTRPYDRVRPPEACSPACTWSGFNPHPALRPSATPAGVAHMACAQEEVSILTRPYDRARRQNQTHYARNLVARTPFRPGCDL